MILILVQKPVLFDSNSLHPVGMLSYSIGVKEKTVEPAGLAEVSSESDNDAVGKVEALTRAVQEKAVEGFDPNWMVPFVDISFEKKLGQGTKDSPPTPPQTVSLQKTRAPPNK